MFGASPAWLAVQYGRGDTPEPPSQLCCLAGQAQQWHVWPVPLPRLPGGVLPFPGAKAPQRGAARHPQVLSPLMGPLAAPVAQSQRGYAEAYSSALAIVKLLPLPIFIIFF